MVYVYARSEHTHLSEHSNLLQHNTHLIAIETSSPVPFWPLSPCPWRLIGADCLLSCCKNFIEFICEKKKGRKRQMERERQRNIRQWNRKMNRNKMKETMCRKLHVWRRWMRKRKRLRKYPLTDTRFLTQSHLIDCPLLLCNLGGFEFYKEKRKTSLVRDCAASAKSFWTDINTMP